jgi:hypothetical protein
VRRLRSWLIVVIVALAYPLAVLAGGGPSFPTAGDCERGAVAGKDIDAVFGHFDTADEARRMQERALAVGFQGTEWAPDACGHVRVFLSGIPTLEVGRVFVREARAAGFDVTLERAG